ncbi:hypothetical protein HDV57DRAFT_248175 [Trichoderma longibrachiatum]|uniref:Uncharacterized protein n=1 Tax=Trichoderma longibrachiatum ATCC 18648 TaxID=983965 RepID=A0A2T4C9R0_TRILO|nr:hypothetical protein M440DRAFT_1189678 [Trichoderma longibrachiatum ATCC 18648]
MSLKCDTLACAVVKWRQIRSQFCSPFMVIAAQVLGSLLVKTLLFHRRMSNDNSRCPSGATYLMEGIKVTAYLVVHKHNPYHASSLIPTASARSTSNPLTIHHERQRVWTPQGKLYLSVHPSALHSRPYHSRCHS